MTHLRGWTQLEKSYRKISSRSWVEYGGICQPGSILEHGNTLLVVHTTRTQLSSGTILRTLLHLPEGGSIKSAYSVQGSDMLLRWYPHLPEDAQEATTLNSFSYPRSAHHLQKIACLRAVRLIT